MEKREVVLKTWELSLYELQRRPQEAVTDDTEIKINPRILHSELMCPICLDVMSNTMTTKECLHRFCSECIITALRNGNKECPTCRNKLVSKRSLRRDPNFDALISKICPTESSDTSTAAAAGNNLNGSFMNSPADSPIPPNGTTDEHDDNMDESNTEQSGRRKRISRGATADSNDSSGDATPGNRKAPRRENTEPTGVKAPKSGTGNSAVSSNSAAKSNIDIILRLKPKEGPSVKTEDVLKQEGSSNTEGEEDESNQMSDQTQNSETNQFDPDQIPICKFLKTVRDATIEHIALYVKLRKDEIQEFLQPSNGETDLDTSEIVFFARKRQSNPPEFMELQKDSTLSFVMSEYSMPKNRPLELYFSVTEL